MSNKFGDFRRKMMYFVTGYNHPTAIGDSIPFQFECGLLVLPQNLNGTRDAILGTNLFAEPGRAAGHPRIGNGGINRLSQIIGGQPRSGNRYWADPQSMDPFPPKRLIAEERRNHRRNARTQSGGCCPGAAMMDDCSHPWKQPTVGDGADRIHRFRQ